MKKLCISLLLAGSVCSVWSQITLTKANCAMRDGDELVKQQVEYVSAGRDGQMVIWDFRKLQPVGEGYKVKYNVYEEEYPALTVATEHRTMYYFRQRGDSLLLSGHENPSVKLNYRREQLQLRYPFRFRDSCQAVFDGQGMYSNKRDMAVSGTTKIKADAYGVLLLPEGDTLKNVLRVQTKQMLRNTTNEEVETEKYSWYTKGYRYPVLEMIKSITKKGDATADYFSVGFYYPIVEQYRLPTDRTNEAERDLTDEDLFGYCAVYPNPCRTDLRIDFNVKDNNTAVVFCLYDLRGQRLQLRERKGLMFGSYTEVLNVSSLASGQYLLEVRIGERRVTEKVIKLGNTF